MNIGDVCDQAIRTDSFMSNSKETNQLTNRCEKGTFVDEVFSYAANVVCDVVEGEISIALCCTALCVRQGEGGTTCVTKDINPAYER
jgi:hypothetical protein